jgi:threonine/homoserine/homoserine lactone efflux protein
MKSLALLIGLVLCGLLFLVGVAELSVSMITAGGLLFLVFVGLFLFRSNYGEKTPPGENHPTSDPSQFGGL